MVEPRSVIANPVLRLLTEPVTGKITGRSKDSTKVKDAILQAHRRQIRAELSALSRDKGIVKATKKNHVLLWVEMDEGSEAASHTPDDLFADTRGTIIYAWRHGYVVDILVENIRHLQTALDSPNARQRCDIFRVAHVYLFAAILAEFGHASWAWDNAPENGDGGKFLLLTPATYADRDATTAAFEYLLLRLNSEISDTVDGEAALDGGRGLAALLRPGPESLPSTRILAVEPPRAMLAQVPDAHTFTISLSPARSCDGSR